MSEIKEHDISESLIPTTYNKDNTELIFTIPCTLLSEIKFKNYFISNNEKPTTNYKSIRFIINGEELNEEEIQTIILKDVIELEDDKVKFKTIIILKLF